MFNPLLNQHVYNIRFSLPNNYNQVPLRNHCDGFLCWPSLSKLYWAKGWEAPRICTTHTSLPDVAWLSLTAKQTVFLGGGTLASTKWRHNLCHWNSKDGFVFLFFRCFAPDPETRKVIICSFITYSHFINDAASSCHHAAADWFEAIVRRYMAGPWQVYWMLIPLITPRLHWVRAGCYQVSEPNKQRPQYKCNWPKTSLKRGHFAQNLVFKTWGWGFLCAQRSRRGIMTWWFPYFTHTMCDSAYHRHK